MKLQIRFVTLSLLTAAHLAAGGAEIEKASNTDPLYLGSSWVGNVAPGAADVALWTNSSAASSLTLGADVSWSGIKVRNSSSSVSISAGNILTLGTNGINLSLASGRSLTLSHALFIADDQTWTIGASSGLQVKGVLTGTNRTVTVVGGGSGAYLNTSGSASGFFGTLNYGAASRFQLQGSFGTWSNAVINLTAATTLQANGLNGSVVVGDLTTANGNAVIGGAGSSAQNGRVTYQVGALGNNSTWAGKIINGSSPTSLLKVGSGVWTLSGTNSYTGTTTINGGAIRVANPAALLGTDPASVVTVNTPNGLQFGNGLADFTVYALVGSASSSVALTNDLGGPVTLTVDQSTNTTFAGALMGGGGLAKLGSGSLTLSGANNYSGLTSVGAGKVSTTTASTGAGAYSVAGSATLSVKMSAANASLNMSSLAAAPSSTIEFDLGAFGKPSPSSPVITVAGDFTPDTTVTLQVVNGGPGLTAGQFPLIKYGNAVSPGLSALTLVVPSGVVASLVDNTANQSIDLNIASITSLVWDGTVDGNWDVGLTPNWKTGVTYDETPLGGPAVRFDDTAAGANTIISSGSPITVNPISVTVSNDEKVYEIGGNVSIGGTANLTKLGTNTLTLSSANTYSGGTILSAGQLNINNASFGGSGSLTINGGVLDNTSGTDVTVSKNNPQTWNGDFTYLGSANNLNLGAGAVTLTTNQQVTVENNKLTIGGNIGGPFSLTKSGAGALALTAVSSLTGGITVNAGTLTLAAAINNSIGSGPLTLNGGLVNLGYNSQYTNPIVIAGAATIQGSANNYDMRGALTGSGTLTLTRANAGVVWFSGNVSGFNGTMICDATGYPGSSNSFGPITNGNTWAGVSVELINGARFRGEPHSVESPGTNRLGAVSGDSSTSLGYFGGIYEVGYRNTSTTFDGQIADSGTNLTAITKVGTGSWTLTGLNSHSGPTVVKAGLLRAQALSSLGYGDVTVASGAQLELDDANAMSSTNNLFLNGANNVMNLNYAGTQTVNTLYINNTPCAAGSWGPVGSGAGNESPALTGTGTLYVSVTGAPLVNNNPINVTYQVSGGTLSLNWPSDHLGWYVQSNSVSLGDSNAWFDVADSQLGTNWVITINPSAPKVFYRLRSNP